LEKQAGLFLCAKICLTATSSGFTLLSMGIDELIGQKRQEILRLAGKYGASHVRVFGSAANGTANENSDIDFLVDLEEGRSLFDLGGMLMDLQALLQRKVDIVTENALHWYIRDRILKEARPL
jgi:predicted nucleotidyltransferase